VGPLLAATRPSWFALAWIVLGAVWIVSRIRRTRRVWMPQRRDVVDTGARVLTFELSDDEQALVGVRQQGDVVIIGPGRTRLAVSLALPFVVAVAALGVAVRDVPPFAVVLALIVTGAAMATAFSCSREAITLTPDTLTVQGRMGDPRTWSWFDVVDIVVEPRDGHDAGILHVVGEPAIDLSILAADAAAAKIAVITRYRMSAHAR
jgi:hypothetical protein